MSDVLCTICARGGSKGVKDKNVRLLNGKPLIAYTIDQALESKLFDHVVVSTDSDQIAEVAKQYGADVFFKRAEALSSDIAGKLDVIKDALLRSEAYFTRKYKYHIDLDATSPLRLVNDIVDSFSQFLKDGNDNLITAMPSRRSSGTVPAVAASCEQLARPEAPSPLSCSHAPFAVSRKAV